MRLIMEDPDDDNGNPFDDVQMDESEPMRLTVDYSDSAVLLSRKERWGRHLILEEQLLLLLLVIVCIR